MYVSMRICVSACVSACACLSECARLSMHVCTSILDARKGHNLRVRVIIIRTASRCTAHCRDHTTQLRTRSRDIENALPVLEHRFATAQAPSSEVNLWICDRFCVFMSKCSWQSHKDTASVRHHLYRYNDGATRWELQRLIIGYLNHHRDRAWRSCQVIKENKLILEVFCLGLGLELHSMVEKSRAMVRATRVDDAFVMPCPNQKTRDVLTISTLGLLIVQICWTILKKKWLDQRRGRMHSSPTVCDWARTSTTLWRGSLRKAL